jgi:hypothetical protein
MNGDITQNVNALAILTGCVANRLTRTITDFDRCLRVEQVDGGRRQGVPIQHSSGKNF